MTDVIVSAEAVEEVQPAGIPEALDDQLIGQLVDRAKADGIKLTGQGGLLQQLTKRILESALEGEINDCLGHEKHEKAADGNTRNGTRSKTVVTEVGAVPRCVRLGGDQQACGEDSVVSGSSQENRLSCR
jgi:hypothetical protein